MGVGKTVKKLLFSDMCQHPGEFLAVQTAVSPHHAGSMLCTSLQECTCTVTQACPLNSVRHHR